MSLENNWSFDFQFFNDPTDQALQGFVRRIVNGDLRFDDNLIAYEVLDGGVMRLSTDNTSGCSTSYHFYDHFSAFLRLVSPRVVGAAHARCQVEGDVEDFFLGSKTRVKTLKSQEALEQCLKAVKFLTKKDLTTLRKAMAKRV